MSGTKDRPPPKTAAQRSAECRARKRERLMLLNLMAHKDWLAELLALKGYMPTADCDDTVTLHEMAQQYLHDEVDAARRATSGCSPDDY